MRVFGALTLSLTILCGAAEAFAASRVALVMGNSKYAGTAELANPTRDATAMGDALKALGFEVIVATDVDRRGAIAAMDAFTRAIAGAEIALFYFAGHGIQIGGQSFLLPTDVAVESERALRYSAIDAQEIVTELERRADVAIAILDACRDNPFLEMVTRGVGGTRSVAVQRGLGPMRLSGRGALVAYAAAAGDVAADGTGEHSPFAAALLEEIDEPNVEVGLMFRRVARRVIDETRGDQHPELLVRLVDEVYLNPTDTGQSIAEVRPSPDAAKPATPGGPAAATTTTAEPRPTVVADDRQAGNGNGRFFGDRVVHAPAWLDGLAAARPSGWRSVAPVAMPEADGNDSYGRAQPLPLAAAVEARIAPRGDADWYRVAVPAAGELRVGVDPAPPELDLFTRAWNSSRTVVADWQGAARQGGALDARLALPAAGEYWIELVDGNNDQESATPFVAAVDFIAADDPFEPNNQFGDATAMPIGADATATIYPRGDNDWYQLWIPAPGLLTATASEVPETLDIAMRLWDLNGKVVRDWATPPRKGGDTVLEAELAAPGIYKVETADSNNDAATVEPFALRFDFAPVPDRVEPNDSFGKAAIVAPTSDHKLAVFPRGDADWLAVDVDHPGELVLSATNSPKDLDIYMRVWTADKQVLRDWFGPGRVGGDVEDFADLPSPGRYFVEIVDGSNDHASPELFDLALTFTPEPDQYEPNDGPADATPLTPGGQVLFNILPRGDADWFRVDVAAAGELAVVVDESPPDLDLHFRVWDGNRKVTRDWVAPYRKGGVAEGFADLPNAGTYFIELVDGGNDARSVLPATLGTVFTPVADSLVPNDAFGEAKPLTLGEPYWSNILPRGDADWYLLEAPRAGSFVVTVDEVDENLDVYVRLWNAEAQAGNWFGPPRPGGVTDAEISVPAPGLYRLEVVDGNNDNRSAKPFRLNVDFK